MFPEVDFTFSSILQTVLLRNDFDFDRLKKYKENIEKIFFKNQDNILEKIQKFTKLKWKENYIQVWIFTGLYDSVPSPVLINCTSGDDDVMLFELTRMLVYNIFIQNNLLNVKDSFIYAVTIKILKEIIDEDRLCKVCRLLDLDTFKKPVFDEALSIKL